MLDSTTGLGDLTDVLLSVLPVEADTAARLVRGRLSGQEDLADVGFRG